MNKKNLLLIVGLIVLVGIFYLAKKKEHVETDFRFIQIDSLAVQSITFSTTEDTIVVEKEDDKWWITHPIRTEAKDDKMIAFFVDIVNVRLPINPMSVNESSHSKYRVDIEQGYRTTIADKAGTIQADFILGEGVNYNFSYVRKMKSNNVFQMKTNAYRICQPKLAQWRSNKILEITEKDVAKVHVKLQDAEYDMIRTPGEIEATWTYKDKDEEFIIDRKNAPMRKFYGVFAGLRSGSFRDGEWETLEPYFDNPEVIATFHLLDGTQQTIYLAKETDKKVLLKRNNDTDTIYDSSLDILSRLTYHKDKFKIVKH
ncbi:MAG: DUF4340 domain-containing protein [Candidatus Zophobacter franzmannii]|nr:DUF4340 domain-containing protein [Candidatus Zophobacter franzmannii]